MELADDYNKGSGYGWFPPKMFRIWKISLEVRALIKNIPQEVYWTVLLQFIVY